MKSRPCPVRFALLALGFLACSLGMLSAAERAAKAVPPAPLERILPSAEGTHFVGADSAERFVVWGLNYDHDATGRLIEDYWEDEWPTVVEDFGEMKALGANVVRVHLQLGRFMQTADTPDGVALERLDRLVGLAEETGLYLDLTGLGCYHERDVPPWYDPLPEQERWAVQARFWEAVARVGRGRTPIFCYDLMNEPIVPGGRDRATEWLTGKLDGKTFVQRIALNPAGRSQDEIAKAWVDLLVAAIRREDTAAMITVGVIPWAHVFPGARPLFHSAEVGSTLDFVSVHFYPEVGAVEQALRALAVYDVGKPLVIEEWFPLQCSIEGLEAFREGSRARADGWIGFYWGKTPPEYADDPSPAAVLTRGWLEYFRDMAPTLRRP